MIATAASRTESKMIKEREKMIKLIGVLEHCWPKSERRRCPATMLAANRTDNVIGRIKFLISSMITIKGIRAVGVPRGIKWERAVDGVLNQNQKTCPSHKGRAMLKVKARWLEGVNTYGLRPKVFRGRMKKNTVIIKRRVGGAWIGVKIALSSLDREEIEIKINNFLWLEKAHKIGG